MRLHAHALACASLAAWCDPELRRTPHSPRCCAPPAGSDDVNEPSSNGADDDFSMGGLLAEILSRQQAKMPASDQLRLDKASLDAMTRSASGELAAEWEQLSGELSAVERNVSSSLQRELADAEAEAMAKILKTERNLRRNLVVPQRRQIRRELVALRDSQQELARRRGDLERPPRLRDEWWEAKVRASDSGLVRTAEISVGGIGALIIVAALNSLAGTVLGEGFQAYHAEAHATLVMAWRVGFGGALAVYLWAITRLFLIDAPPSREDIERR